MFVCMLGTRIIYERKFLMELRNSPLAKTPPVDLPVIPGVTCAENTKVEHRKPAPDPKPIAGESNSKMRGHCSRVNAPRSEQSVLDYP